VRCVKLAASQYLLRDIQIKKLTMLTADTRLAQTVIVALVLQIDMKEASPSSSQILIFVGLDVSFVVRISQF
jgi:hypothetical protein